VVSYKREKEAVARNDAAVYIDEDDDANRLANNDATIYNDEDDNASRLSVLPGVQSNDVTVDDANGPVALPEVQRSDGRSMVLVGRRQRNKPRWMDDYVQK